MKDFLDYDIKYPDLIIKVIDYFTNNGSNRPQKTILDFCNDYKVPKGENPIQPIILSRICERLCELRKMFCIQKINGHTDIYYSVPYDKDLWKKYPHVLIHHYNSCIYGFEYIYRHYKERTFPVIATTENGQSMGSCFRIYQGIATAKHCLTDGKPIAIKGYSKEQLDRFPVFVSKNPDIDIAFIQTGEVYLHNYAEPHVLDNVLVMGYPKIPLFLNFCTGEKANISAIADLRFTPTIGSIVAEGEIYYPKNLPKMLLVTAKMEGGNSGGPVINEDGYVVGIATGIPDGEGLSDDHVGYGIAYPIKVLDEIIEENHMLKVEFMDFPE